MSAIVDLLARMLPRKLVARLRRMPPHSRLSFSVEGEDLLLHGIFEGRSGGFFIDVGAHHPTRFSNTYLLYLQGWRGLNIDAMPGSMLAFRESRPEDTNIECAVSDRREELTFFIFNETALNTFSEEEAARKDGLGSFRIVERRSLATKTLAELVDEHVPRGREVDLLSVDVEGMDLRVLMSLDWSKCRPAVVLVEDLSDDFEAACDGGAIKAYLEPKGYRLFAKTLSTLFFKRNG